MQEKTHAPEMSEESHPILRTNRLNRNILLICTTREEALVPYYILSESSILKRIVDTDIFQESKRNAIFLPIAYPSLKRIVEYLWYKYNYRMNNGIVEDFKIEDSETLDLLEVSSFLRL